MKYIALVTIFTLAQAAYAGTISSGGEPGAKGRSWNCTGGTPADFVSVTAESTTDFPALGDLKFNRSIETPDGPVTYLAQALPVNSHLSYENGEFQMTYTGSGKMFVFRANGDTQEKQRSLSFTVRLNPIIESGKYKSDLTLTDIDANQIEKLDLTCTIVEEKN